MKKSRTMIFFLRASTSRNLRMSEPMVYGTTLCQVWTPTANYARFLLTKTSFLLAMTAYSTSHLKTFILAYFTYNKMSHLVLVKTL